ncbi:hypothetical protein [Elizabethkingia miricola]|uniref:hypothetical protein n=1 Tax=Elizabethkingia miricola TaxID=172045 RepID=UPI002ACD5C2C|nr:hypothetical protein [Elizabethkingia miricola]WQM39430.1 hypothetical protein U2S95_04025 [Elizabethkingia miricola]
MQKLGGQFFASAPGLEFQVNNEKYTYTVFQLGKRKKKIYLYLKILEDNICLKKERNVDIYFKSGEIMFLRNEYPLNCDSFFARELQKKELQKLKDNEIKLIKIYTYKKNYELNISDVQNKNIHRNINCLSEYKIKR